MNKYWKIILGVLCALAVALGLLQRKDLPDFSFGSKTNILHFATPSADSLAGYYQKSQEISQSASQKSQQVSFLAVGDIMLSRNVAAKIKDSNDIELPFKNMSGIFNSVSFSFGNLESPLGEVVGGHSMIFGAPPTNIEGLVKNNFKILNLANNHAMDQGLNGLVFTKKYLNSVGIQTVGVGQDLAEAWQPEIVEKNGIKIGFIGASYASINDSGKTTNNYVARIEDVTRLQNLIQVLKQQADFVVITMHAGIEYTRNPNQAQITFAHAAIDAGADVVIGAHPHWVQTIEKYQEKYIFYSLGNFIFDQEWSQDTKEGLALKINLSKPQFQANLQGPKVPAQLDSIELLPIIIENFSTPRPATAEETKKILDKIVQNETVLK